MQLLRLLEAKKRDALQCCVVGQMGSNYPPPLSLKGKKANHKSIREIQKQRGTIITVQRNAWMTGFQVAVLH